MHAELVAAQGCVKLVLLKTEKEKKPTPIESELCSFLHRYNK